MKKTALVSLLSLLMIFAAAKAALTLELTVYSDIDCFHWPGITQRLCNQWSLMARADSGLIWHCLISGIAMNDELMNKKIEFSKADKKRLISALQKGLKWAQAAQAKKVDIVKRIDKIGEMEVDFLSTGQGRECVVRFRTGKLFREGPVHMFTPYVHNKTTEHSIKSMIASLSASDKLYKQALEKQKKRYDMFK